MYSFSKSLLKGLVVSFYLAFFIAFSSPAQTSGSQAALDRPVTVQLTNVRLADALSAIAGQVGCTISYHSNRIDADKHVDVDYRDIPAAQALSRLLGNTLRKARVVDNQIFLQMHADAKGTLKGVVKTSDGQPGEFVTVSIRGTGKGTRTDEQGLFTLQNIPAGKQVVVIQLLGYEAIVSEIEIPEDGEITLPPVFLREDSRTLQEVIVRGTNVSYKTDLPSQSLRIQTPLMETPQSITVIGRGILDDQSLLTTTDVTRNVSGVTTIYPYANIYTDFNIRGTRATSNKLRNGMLMASGGMPQEDMSYVESVEFIKGPAGFMLAQGEPGGMYNVVTKKPQTVSHAAATFAVGSYGLYRTSVDVGGPAGKKLLYRLNVMGQKSGTHLDYGHNDRLSLAPAVTFRLTEKTSLTAEYNLDLLAVNGAFAQTPTLNHRPIRRSFMVEDPAMDPVRLANHYTLLNLQHQLGSDWKFTAQTGHTRAKQHGGMFYTNAAIEANGLLPRSYRYQDIRNDITTGQFFLNGKVRTGNVSHRILLGIDGGVAQARRRQADARNIMPINIYNPSYGFASVIDTLIDVASLPFTGHTRTLWQAATVLDDIRLTPWLQVTLGGRYTHYQWGRDKGMLVDKVFSPRVGLLVRPDQTTSVYALYDQAFVPQTGVSFSGEQFEPVTGNNLEFGLKKEWFQKRLLTQFAFYHIVKNNALTGDLANPGFSIQTGRIKSRGVEVDITGSINQNLSIVANYAYTDSKITRDTNKNLIGTREQAPVHTLNGWLKYTFASGVLNGLGVGLGASSYLDRYIGTTKKNPTDIQQKLPDFTSINGALYYRTGRLNLALNVDNLTDKYNYIGFYNGNMGANGEFLILSLPGRNFRLSATCRF